MHEPSPATPPTPLRRTVAGSPRARWRTAAPTDTRACCHSSPSGLNIHVSCSRTPPDEAAVSACLKNVASCCPSLRVQADSFGPPAPRPRNIAPAVRNFGCPDFFCASAAARRENRDGAVKSCVCTARESASTGRRRHGVGKMLGGSWVERDSGLRRHFHVFPPRDERPSRSRPT